MNRLMLFDLSSSLSWDRFRKRGSVSKSRKSQLPRSITWTSRGTIRLSSVTAGVLGGRRMSKRKGRSPY